MIQAFKRVFQLPELKHKILFTLGMLAVFRIGRFIPVPGINGEVALHYFRHAAGGGQNLFQMVDIFSGGAFSQMTVFALGVVPYISASIILQLLVALIPSLQREIKENPDYGRKKITKLTRLGAMILAFIQASLFAKYALQMNLSHPGIVSPDLLGVTLFGCPWLFYLIVIVTMTTGTVFLMWVGEQITDRGIGNGMSLIIGIGILSQLPSTMGLIIQQLNLDSPEPGQLNFFSLVILFSLFVLISAGTIFILQGQRRIPLQYARRMSGMREVQPTGSSYIPLKVNYAGVIPVIFASSLLMFPATLAQFLGYGNWFGKVASYFVPGTLTYLVSFVMLIIFFTYFWTATQFRPDQIASDMKKGGAFIPGVKQGKQTQEFLEKSMSTITLVGSVLLAGIAVLPSIVGRLMNVSSSISYFFGGTTLLILVGVVLDTMKQIESHLLMKRYDGFMKRGRVR